MTGTGESGLPLWRSADTQPFTFLDALPMLDRELELVAPDLRWVDDMLEGCQHPSTQLYDPEHAATTRQKLLGFLDAAPGGREPPDASRGRAPSYHFWMRLRPEYYPPIAIAGAVALRVGHGPDLEMYCGHIGYNVFPPARGQRYAERACRLLFNLARAHHLRPLWITTNPDNIASRRTCERLGAVLVDIVDVPPDHPLYLRGQRRKCRYRLEL